MKTPRQKLEDRLEAEGWELEQAHTTGLEWWADEIWQLKSRWKPTGTAAFITLLVDPQFDGLRKKGQHVWGAGISASFPASKREAEGSCSISLNDLSSAKIEAFIGQLHNLRQQTS